MRVFIHISLIITFLSAGELFAQSASEIKDIVNRYVKVFSMEGASAVNVMSSAGFSTGDTVLIVQMKGAIYSPDDPNVINQPANVGKYEFTVINSVSGTKITFNSPLKNAYDVSETVQLIRVPSYSDAVVVSKLTCAAWDGEKGGILALIATSSLTLNADIDVTGKGFRGGAPVYYSVGKCFATSGVPFSKFHILNASQDSTSGIKGEGIITNQFPFTRGRAPRGNGGGAGTGAYSGGGGGGNSGIGGNGAREECAGDEDLNWGGNGGRVDAQYFSNSFSQRRIYLGGGGGSGIQKTLSSGTAGGNGGGVIILLVPHLITNNYTIIANGDNVTDLVTNGSSSGGGGGGGMVLLAVDSVKNNLRVSSSGGNGGGTSGSLCDGQGGGGGGGFVWFSGQSLNFSLLNISGGEAGGGSCDVSSTAGNTGDSLNRLILPLTGFLNNTIRSAKKTCYNTRQLIKGSRPQGGNGIYTFQWQHRNYGSTTWLAAPGKNDSVDYMTTLLTDTTQFRRIVSSDGMNDISSTLTIQVFPQITNNVVNPDTILCFGSPSVKIRGSQPGGGIGNFTYEWTRRGLSGSWEAVPGVNNTKDYTVSSDVTRYYRRKVTSDYCSTYDSVKVEILPVINDNLISPRQTICSGAVPVPFTGSSPAGGTGTYKYQWQQSNDSLSWTNSAIISKDLTAPAAHTQTTFYRRLVMSGLNDCCRDTSKNIKITVLPLISNNTVTAPQTICQGTVPALFNGSAPAGGDIASGYRFKWESSRDNVKWDSIQYSPLLQNFQAPAQDTSMSFRRIVYSGLNDCCKNTSSAIKITVQPGIKNNMITGDTTICDNAVPALIKGLSAFTGGDGSNYAVKWRQKTAAGLWMDIPGATQISYQPPALSDSVSYQRIVTSGTCTHLSNSVNIHVLNTIQGNSISGNNVVCEGFPSGQLGSGIITGGEPGIYRFLWEKSTDGTNWELMNNETSAQLMPGILPQNMHFRRKVKSGLYDCCQSTSNSHFISIDKKPEAPDAGANRELIYQDTAMLSAKSPAIGTGIWTSSSEADINSPAKNTTRVTGLTFGRHVFYWTVANGVCPVVNDSVILHVNDLKRYTGFSPNGDGINDYFVVSGLSNAPNKDLTILNRWGVEVFHSSDYQNDWDGKNKSGNPLPEDTYFYILKVKDIYDDGKNRVYKGYFVIKR